MVKKGDRIELEHMGDDPDPIIRGSRGTVKGVDDAGHVLVLWDNGRTLSLVPKIDQYRILTPKDEK